MTNNSFSPNGLDPTGKGEGGDQPPAAPGGGVGFLPSCLDTLNAQGRGKIIDSTP